MASAIKYGDERDELKRKLKALGGNSYLINDALKSERLRRTFDPIPYSQSAMGEKRDSTDFLSPLETPPKKVSIVGCGQVGLAIAYAMLNQGICGMIALTDIAGTKLEGEVKDLQQGSAFHRRVDVVASTDYDVTADSDLVIITAGAAQRPGESRLSLVGRNVNIMRSIVPKVLEFSPGAPICIVANPCDIMTAVAAKIAGPSVPPGRIFGSGTVLDSGRFCSVIGSSLNVDVRSVQGFVIGEHGDSSVPIWSSVRVGGVPFLEPGEKPSDTHESLHKAVVNSAGEVIQKKGYTNWAVGLAVARIAEVVLRDERMIMPVSTCVRGVKGVTEDVFVSIPCVVGATGVKSVVDIPLNDYEYESFTNSVNAIWDVQSGVWDEI